MFAELLSEGGLSLDRLQSFCLVAQAGGVTKAAKGNPAKQSLFSRQIKELEEFFGAELMRRKGRGIVLTAAGERLNVLARESFASLLDFKSACKGLPVEIVVGAGESVIDWVLMPRLAEVRNKLPNVRLKFLNLTTSEMVRRLADGTIDFGVMRKDVAARPLQCVSLGVMGYSLFLPKGLRGSRPGAKALDGLPLATLEGEGSFRRQLSVLARNNRLSLKIEIECASFPLVARAVATGSVAAILPSVAALDLAPLGVQEVKIGMFDSLKRELCVAWTPRLLRIRPALEKVSEVLPQVLQI
jgi:DNA-binding transcriptional LysR family regulator